MTVIVRANPASLENVDIGAAFPLVSWHPDRLHFFAAKEQYRLVSLVARAVGSAFPDAPMVDIGSPLMHAAAALWTGARAAGSNAKVLAFCNQQDPEASWRVPESVQQLARESGIEALDVTVTSALEGIDDLVQRQGCKLMVLDKDPHDGVFERLVIQKLMDLDYRGLLIMDDARLNPEMANVIKWAPLKKVDATHLGHWSGTTVLVFDPAAIDFLAE
jgi:hypothetical protein